MRALCLVLLIASTTADVPYSPEPWLQDLQQIESEMSLHYANLDSAIQDRHADLVGLRKRAEMRIRNATSTDGAKQAIDLFMGGFGDGHAYVDWNFRPKATDQSDKPLCQRMGYQKRERPGVRFEALSSFQPITDADSYAFPGGVLRLSGGHLAGVIRITLFSAERQVDLCSEAQKTLGLADDAKCEGDCEHALELAVDNLATAALERRIESLRRAGAELMVIDITGNGGGSNWVEPAARVLTPIPLRSPRLGFIRHEHWIRDFRDRLDDVEHGLANSKSSNLLRARETLQHAIEEASGHCDRSAVWSEPPVLPDCSLVVSRPLFTSGLLPYAKPGSLPKDDAPNILFLPSQYTYHEGANRLPLFVLVDEGTASSAEYFTAMLKDNGAATIVGLPTLGSGCGHTNGGIWATLQNSGGRLSLPDCVRYRSDGTNEIVGIVPDVLVPWSEHDSPYQHAAKAKVALERVIKIRRGRRG